MPDSVTMDMNQTNVQEPATSNQEPAEGELIAGKYKTQEELVAAYKELEKKLGEQPAAADAISEPATEPNAASEPAVNEPDFDISKYEESYTQNGGLTEDEYKELADRGFTKEIVDNYIEGRKATAQKEEQEILQAAGMSADTFTQARDWALENLSQDEMTAFNNIVSTGDKMSVAFALQGLYAKYQKANPQPAQKVKTLAGAVSKPGYESWAQVTRDMSDPRYHKDPAFRKSVEERLAQFNGK